LKPPVFHWLWIHATEMKILEEQLETSHVAIREFLCDLNTGSIQKADHLAGMRKAIGWFCGLVLVMVVCGCGPSIDNPFSADILDRNGSNRLTLIYVPLGFGPNSNSQAFRFHSLIWRSKDGTNWTSRVTITKADFNSGAVRERWISEIYSLDAATGNAVIKVAEISSPVTNGAVRYEACSYSWREWNLTSNQEVRILQVCKKPSEPFHSKRFKLK